MGIFDSITDVYKGVYDPFGFSGGSGGDGGRRAPNRDEAASPAIPLENLAQRAGDLADQRDPIFEQALAQALREQGQASVEQTEQATGITGAAQIQMALSQFLQSQGQAAAAAQAKRVENERALLNVQVQLMGQAGQLREQRYETNQRHQEFLMQLKAQQDAMPSTGEKLLGAAAGIATAFATGGGSLALGGAAAAAGGMFAPTADQGAFLGGAQGRASSAATSQFGPMAGLQGFFGALGSPPSPTPTAADPDPFDPYNLFGFGV
jgi:hypothetical protein